MSFTRERGIGGQKKEKEWKRGEERAKRDLN
jgi:hypothetical protein